MDDARPPRSGVPRDASSGHERDARATVPFDDDLTIVGDRTPAAEVRNDPLVEAIDPEINDTGRHVRVFGSRAFFRLWLVQVISSTGDWLGFIAIIAIAADIAGEDISATTAISLVLIPRILPGLFLASAGGVIVDRFNRQKVMVVCDVMRAGLVLLVPFVDSLITLILLSFLIEIATSLWAPAKEAVIPSLTPTSHLTSANSLGLIATYGTAPVAAALFAGIAASAEQINEIDALSWLDGPRLALGVDSITFLVSALLVSSLPIVARSEEARQAARRTRLDFGSSFRELRDGWTFILGNQTVRAVMLGLGTGMIGGGLVVPLGEQFSTDVLDAGSAGFGLFMFALGLGVALGVLVISAVQQRLAKDTFFVMAVFTGGVSLALAASVSNFAAAFVFVTCLGIGAGGVYVLGFTLLHETVEDELRGRVFAALYVTIRFCVLIAIALGPLLAAVLGWAADELVDGRVSIGSVGVDLPGVRLALWFGAALTLAAGVIAATTFGHRGPRRDTAEAETEAEASGEVDAAEVTDP